MAAYQDLSFVNYRSQFFDGATAHTLVDVRSAFEFRQGHVPGAINIPLDELESRAHEVPQNQPVVVICASGNRSRTGAAILTQKGYSHVYNLQGGTMVWMMNGLQLAY